MQTGMNFLLFLFIIIIKSIHRDERVKVLCWLCFGAYVFVLYLLSGRLLIPKLFPKLVKVHHQAAVKLHLKENILNKLDNQFCRMLKTCHRLC